MRWLIKHSVYGLLISGLLIALGCSSSSNNNKDTAVGGDNDIVQEEEVSDSTDVSGGEVDTVVGDVDVKSPAADELAAAKEALENGEPVQAIQHYKKALELDPNNRDGLFGMALAKTIDAVEMAGMLVTLESQYQGYGAGPGTRGSENDFMAETISHLFEGIRSELVDASKYLAKVDPDGFSWECKHIPVYFSSQPLMIYSGRFDQADLHLIAATQDFIIGTFDVVVAQDLSSDLITAYKLAKGHLFTSNTVAALKIFAYLMAYSKDFLNLKGEKGVELFNDGAKRMVSVGEHLAKAFELLMDEDNREGDISTWLPKKMCVAIHNQAYVDDNAELKTKPLLICGGDDFLEDTQNLVEALKGDSKIVHINDGLMLQLSTLLHIGAKLGIIDSFGIKLPIDAGAFKIEQLKGMLAAMLNLQLGFDFAKFNKTPTGLRVVMPAIKWDGKDPYTAKLLIEWECPDEVAANGGVPKGKGSLMCSADAKLEDSAHFVGTPYEIPADGKPSRAPYIAWEDPSFGGLLYVNTNDDPKKPPKWEKATNYTLNMVLQKVISQFLK